MRASKRGHASLRRWGLTLLLAAWCGGGVLRAAGLAVDGLGFFADRSARNNLALLLGPQRVKALNAGAIEDGAMILFSQLDDEGYLKAKLTIKVTLTDGRQESFALDQELTQPLPRDLHMASVVFAVERGRRYYLQEVDFAGLHALSVDEARQFFVGESMLIPLASERIYSPGRLQRSIGNLAEELHRQGYADATVEAGRVTSNDGTGATRVHVIVKEGSLWQVDTLHVTTNDGSQPPENLAAGRTSQPWNALWRQNLQTTIMRWYFQRGHPDVRVAITPQAAPPRGGHRAVAVTVSISPGPEVTLGKIRFEGDTHTRTPLIRRLVDAQPGQPLNPVALDNGQARLARLGVFNRVGLTYEPEDGTTRDAVYQLSEGRRQDVSLLAGYGSYEELRGGVEWRHYNLFGRAHTDDLKLIQSMKSTQGDYLYTVPELFGTTVDGSTRLFGLRRDELSFVREEFGATASLLWPLPRWDSTLTTAYTFSHLRSADNQLATNTTDLTQTDVAAMDFTLVNDRRDNPLMPHRGYKLYAQLEEASTWLGGRVDYQKYTVDASYHTAWGHGRWIHLGLTHGVITTFGSKSDIDLPVNVRFFPGGDGSIRGYTRGEASPRAANGQFIGAKSIVQFNTELEQALTHKWSVVAFLDGLGTAVSLKDYPAADWLYSAGLGIRYNTIVGPIRLEYGHNLNPRPGDPSGTLLLSVGFPF
jgi:outer membrane protein assembly complex protein YaeT